MMEETGIQDTIFILTKCVISSVAKVCILCLWVT